MRAYEPRDAYYNKKRHFLRAHLSVFVCVCELRSESSKNIYALVLNTRAARGHFHVINVLLMAHAWIFNAL